jgi:hypothetical protein
MRIAGGFQVGDAIKRDASIAAGAHTSTSASAGASTESSAA